MKVWVLWIISNASCDPVAEIFAIYKTEEGARNRCNLEKEDIKKSDALTRAAYSDVDWQIEEFDILD